MGLNFLWKHRPYPEVRFCRGMGTSKENPGEGPVAVECVWVAQCPLKGLCLIRGQLALGRCPQGRRACSSLRFFPRVEYRELEGVRSVLQQAHTWSEHSARAKENLKTLTNVTSVSDSWQGVNKNFMFLPPQHLM